MSPEQIRERYEALKDAAPGVTIVAATNDTDPASFTRGFWIYRGGTTSQHLTLNAWLSVAASQTGQYLAAVEACRSPRRHPLRRSRSISPPLGESTNHNSNARSGVPLIRLRGLGRSSWALNGAGAIAAARTGHQHGRTSLAAYSSRH